MTQQLATITALIISGMVLIVLELLIPTFGLVAVAALFAFGMAVYTAFGVSATVGWIVVAVVAIGMPAYTVWLVRVLPNSRLGRRVFLPDEQNRTLGDSLPDVPTLSEYIGKSGTADSLLRPSGAVRVEGKRLYAMAQSGIIAKGSEIEVVGVHGSDLIVREKTETETTTTA